ncbi:hypothetical protein KCU57_05265 [Xanthomonas translucens]|nr:hypothetical protein [Xanthomonas translucens]UKE51727.1 hypothetical protein KCU57_05265 [Xanthomonas translucens]
MKPIDQALADAANDSYANRPQSDVDSNNKYASLELISTLLQPSRKI